jgi:dUTP pyrophosphatase
MILKFAKLTETAKSPERKNITDAGLDVYSDESLIIRPFTSQVVGTGITIQVPGGYFFLIKPKGSSYHLIGAGVIDSYYEPGEIKVKVVNFTEDNMIINRGDALGQLILIPIGAVDIKEVVIGELYNKSLRSGSGSILGESVVELEDA